MKRDDIRKLLGGYATGTLTGKERQALYEAALDDQQLFDALADEEALRQLLADPDYRRELAAELATAQPSAGEKIAAWWRRPLTLALGGAVAALVVVAVILYPRFQPEAPVEIAQMRQETAPPPAELRKAPAKKKVAAEPPAPAASAPAMAADKELKQELADAAQPKPAASKRMRGRLSAQRQNLGREESALAEAVPSRPAPAMAMMERRAATAALECIVQHRSPDGSFQPVSPAHTVNRQDYLRLRVRVPAAGTIYVFEQQPGGATRLIQTTPVPGSGTFPVPKNEPLAPPTKPGERQLIVLFSTQPLSIPSTGSIQEADTATNPTVSVTIRYR